MLKKIFIYELKRMIINKFYFGTLAVLLLYGWQVLATEIIQGIAHTAPFSAWSFGQYFIRLSPLLCAAVILFVYQLFNQQARRFHILTDATPVDAYKLFLVQCAVVLTALLLLSLLLAGVGFGFMAGLFGSVVSAGNVLVPALLQLLPVLFFCTGVLMLAGKRKAVWLLPAAGCILLAAALPGYSGLFSGFFSEYPLTLAALDPPLAVNAEMLIARLVYFVMGVLALLVSARVKPA